MANFFTSRLFFISLVCVVVAATLPLYVSGFILGLLTVAQFFPAIAVGGPPGIAKAAVTVNQTRELGGGSVIHVASMAWQIGTGKGVNISLSGQHE